MPTYRKMKTVLENAEREKFLIKGFFLTKKIRFSMVNYMRFLRLWSGWMLEYAIIWISKILSPWVVSLPSKEEVKTTLLSKN